jgi:hypothetical protein
MNWTGYEQKKHRPHPPKTLNPVPKPLSTAAHFQCCRYLGQQ